VAFVPPEERNQYGAKVACWYTWARTAPSCIRTRATHEVFSNSWKEEIGRLYGTNTTRAAPRRTPPC
jgi:hypothetical protein